MIWIDAALLDACERLCRRLQVLTGRTNVWLAVQITNLSIVVFFVWTGAFLQFGGRATRVVVGAVSLALLYFLSQTLLRTPVEASEQNAYRRVARGLRNPRRMRDAPLRISFLTVTVFLAYPLYWLYSRYGVQLALLTYFLLGLTTGMLYLLACDPLPPQPDAVAEPRRQPVSARAPAPGSTDRVAGARRARAA